MSTLNLNYLPTQRPHVDILNIFATAKQQTEHGFVSVSAPMVRYSKLEFRRLLRQQGVQLAFTPMIIADSFVNSQNARENEFTTCADDIPCIAQFAACNAEEFTTAAQLIYPYVDGVDLNCGCPQSWAIAKGYGCGLLRQPELLRDIVQSARRTLPQPFSISVKLRLLNGSGERQEQGIRATVELARQLERCGVTFLSLHGRTMWQRTSDPLNVHAMSEVKKSLQVPLVVNGNVRNWQDAVQLHAATQADGVMAARGLLSNPALFNASTRNEQCVDGEEGKTRTTSLTPMECAQQWLDIASQAGDHISFQCFHHHLTFMWSSHMKRKQRLEFNSLTNKKDVFDFFEERYGLKPQDVCPSPFLYTNCIYPTIQQQCSEESKAVCDDAWNEQSDGKFFNEFKVQVVGKAASNKRDDFELEDSFFTDLG